MCGGSEVARDPACSHAMTDDEQCASARQNISMWRSPIVRSSIAPSTTRACSCAAGLIGVCSANMPSPTASSGRTENVV